MDNFNGQKVVNLKHLNEMVEASTDEFLVFGLSHTQTVVLNRPQALAATPAILAQHSIAAHRSAVL